MSDNMPKRVEILDRWHEAKGRCPYIRADLVEELMNLAAGTSPQIDRAIANIRGESE